MICPVCPQISAGKSASGDQAIWNILKLRLGLPFGIADAWIQELPKCTSRFTGGRQLLNKKTKDHSDLFQNSGANYEHSGHKNHYSSSKCSKLILSVASSKKDSWGVADLLGPLVCPNIFTVYTCIYCMENGCCIKTQPAPGWQLQALCPNLAC